MNTNISKLIYITFFSDNYYIVPLTVPLLLYVTGEKYLMRNYKSVIKLTKDSLQNLKDKGFRYVLVKGYTLDRRMEYIELNNITLTPVKDLSTDPNKKGIYEPIESKILTQWAEHPESGVKVVIEFE
jgi:hypothetical protein